MDITLTDLAVVGVGVVSGILSGMLGVGGAVITTPGIRAFGATPIEAVGSTIPAILPSALSGTVRYAREGLVDWRVGGVCGLTGAALASLGAWVSDLVDAHLLMVITALLLGWSGLSLFRSASAARRSETGTSDDDAPPTVADAGDGTEVVTGIAAETRTSSDIGTPALAGIGAGAGFVAGLLGVGGGVVMMPLFTKVLRLPVKAAVASSLVAVAIFSVPALVTHTLLDHIDWRLALALVVGVVPGAQIGARITVGSSERTVRLFAGIFFMGLAVLYGGSELVALF